MNLLYVTDHRFHLDAGRVFDAYCFDRAYFEDYRKIFKRVTVAARLRHDSPPVGARRADGNGVYFVRLPDRRGTQWATSMPRVVATLAREISRADAVCLRIPSLAGALAFEFGLRARRPMMFEFAGDPLAANRGAENGLVSALAGRLIARWCRRVVQLSAVGSYVSEGHLQRIYPPGASTVWDAVSSIRLTSEWISGPRSWPETPSPLNVLLVASFVPVKRHGFLLRCLARARVEGLSVSVTLVGDGPTRGQTMRLAEELGVAGHVSFLGHVASRARLMQEIDKADLFTMTSASEGLPRAMIEAMARGCPAAGPKIPGVAELLPNTWLFDRDAEEELVALWRKALKLPKLLEEASMHSVVAATKYRQDRLSTRRQALLRQLVSHVGRGE